MSAHEPGLPKTFQQTLATVDSAWGEKPSEAEVRFAELGLSMPLAGTERFLATTVRP